MICLKDEGWSTVPACKLTCGSFSVTCGLPPPRQLRWRMLSSCPSVEGYRIYRNPATSNPKIQTIPFSLWSPQAFHVNSSISSSKSPNDSVNQTIVLHRANPLDPSNAEDLQRISPWTAHGSLEQRHPKHPTNRRSRHVQCPWHHLVASVAVAEPWGLWYPRIFCGTLATKLSRQPQVSLHFATGILGKNVRIRVRDAHVWNGTHCNVCVYVLKIWSQKDELPKSQQFKHIA